MKRPFLIVALVLGLVFLALPVYASLIYEDTRFGNTITYELEYTSGEYNFYVTSTDGGTGDWYLGGVLFHFGPAPGNDITDLSASYGDWEDWDPIDFDSIWWGKGDTSSPSYFGLSRPTAFSGFVFAPLRTTTAHLDYDDPNLEITELHSLSFTFDVVGGPGPSLDDAAPLSFKALYFDGPNGGSGNFKTTQTSAALVPEPASMLLLGTGLIGLAGFRKKFKK